MQSRRRIERTIKCRELPNLVRSVSKAKWVAEAEQNRGQAVAGVQTRPRVPLVVHDCRGVHSACSLAKTELRRLRVPCRVLGDQSSPTVQQVGGREGLRIAGEVGADSLLLQLLVNYGDLSAVTEAHSRTVFRLVLVFRVFALAWAIRVGPRRRGLERLRNGPSFLARAALGRCNRRGASGDEKCCALL